ncbi:carboxypeptidase-like regulatory domain-containing protein [Flavobacterium cerinum]|uniref:Carboxypeptidase-like regulatory domain-containing protein n=1 Tax=Flavobacterium cerinum TaxID=2502784 RepID=A0A3S3QLT8_9FLAO|nr:carboxypeptidase-like regulatory domain-containing protein [Flavobacterium cerinum]RWX01486.1 hypothetical protein EPI11_05915 [Flavobacterium cerinum]
MKKPIQISIPSPCHENWQQMTAVDKGRFCASCEKKVFDFTNSSDREIASILKNTENACGRFSLTQIDRDLIVPKEKSAVWVAASAAVISLLTVGTNQALAQTPLSTEQHQNNNTRIVLGKVASPRPIITGTVSNSLGEVLPGALIKIKNSSIGKQADLDGRFSIEANPGEVLQISYIGYKDENYTVNETKQITIIMNEEEYQLQGDIIIVQKRSFFGKIFNSIGSIFR